MSPDGQRIAFSRYKTETISIMAKTVDGSGSEETLLSAQRSSGVVHLIPTSWSPDGKFLAYMEIGGSGKREIGVLPLEGERRPQLLLANQFDNSSGSFSPDGKYLAYVSNETGRNEVYVMPFGNGSGNGRSLLVEVARLSARSGSEMASSCSTSRMGRSWAWM